MYDDACCSWANAAAVADADAGRFCVKVMEQVFSHH